MNIVRHEWRTVRWRLSPPDLRGPVELTRTECVRCGEDWMGANTRAMMAVALRLRRDGDPDWQGFQTHPDRLRDLHQRTNEKLLTAPMCSLALTWPDGALG